LMINSFHSSMNQNSNEKFLDSMTTQNSSAIAKLIEFDFNRMGLEVGQNTTALIVADSNRITFLSDINENGNVDTVKYFLSDVNAASMTENPRDMILYRLVNNEVQRDSPLGVTEFNLRYFDSIGNEITDVTQIRTFEVTLTVESTMPADDIYSAFYWQTRISPPNLLRF